MQAATPLMDELASGIHSLQPVMNTGKTSYRKPAETRNDLHTTTERIAENGDGVGDSDTPEGEEAVAPGPDARALPQSPPRMRDIAYVRLKRRERANCVVPSSSEKYSFAKAVFEPVMEQLSDASSVDFYKQLQYWKTLVAEGLQHAESCGQIAVIDASTGDDCESEEKPRNAEIGGSESDTSTIVGAAEMAEAFEKLSEMELGEDIGYSSGGGDVEVAQQSKQLPEHLSSGHLPPKQLSKQLPKQLPPKQLAEQHSVCAELTAFPCSETAEAESKDPRSTEASVATAATANAANSPSPTSTTTAGSATKERQVHVMRMVKKEKKASRKGGGGMKQTMIRIEDAAKSEGATETSGAESVMEDARSVNALSVPAPKRRTNIRTTLTQTRKPSKPRYAVLELPGAQDPTPAIPAVLQWARHTHSLAHVKDLMDKYPVKLTDPFLEVAKLTTESKQIRSADFDRKFVLPRELLKRLQAAIEKAKRRRPPSRYFNKEEDAQDGMVKEILVTIDPALPALSRYVGVAYWANVVRKGV
ncbi:hypothetical protein BBJ28_00023545 [Nothophytophthora sp. Chile5]|nr:hypothetical protein BBJ28_00023545 [Nothophytophthora sp. Chile5]